MNQEEGAHKKCDPAVPLILAFPASGNVRNTFLFFYKLPSL